MAAFQNILIPVDFSQRCRQSAPFVADMVDRCHATLTVLHVIDLPVSVYTTVGYETILDLPAMRLAAREQLDAFIRVQLGGRPVRAVVEEGRAATRIAGFTSEGGFDLVMLPTHGYGPFRQALLGSVTAKVLHDVRCPVWTEAHVENPAGRFQRECGSMLCAVDLDPGNVLLIRRAAGLAQEFGARLHLVHAVEEASPQPETHFDLEHRAFLFDRARTALAALQVEAGTDFDLCIDCGSVAKVVQTVAGRHHADLVVIGRGAIQEPLGRLRTNTYAVIRESICPILSC